MADAPRRLPRSVRRGVALVVFLASAAAGAWVASSLAPDRLRLEVERQVAEAIGGPCRIVSLRVAPGLPIEVEADQIALWDGALTVERAIARVSIAAALVGELRLSRLALEDPVLSVRDGGPFRAPEVAEPATSDAPEDLLVALHDATRRILGALALADTLIIRQGRVDFALDAEPTDIVFSLEDVSARIGHHRLRGDSTLVAQARIRAGEEHRGLVEWNGSHRVGEPQRLSIAVSELDLAWVGSLAPAAPSHPRGWISGVADFELTDHQRAKVALDLVGREFGWTLADDRASLFEVPRVSALVDLGIEPGRVALHAARIRGGPIDAVIEGRVTRPLRADSTLDYSVRVDDVLVDELVALLTSTPAPWVEDAGVVLEALDVGRVATFRARSSGPLADLGGDASRGSRGLPPGLELTASFEDLRVAIGEEDAIEGISLRAKWARDRVALRDVVGRRAGLDLPRLDLEIANVSRLLDADLARRVPESADVLLSGLPLLLKLLEPDPDAEIEPPVVDLTFSRLDHPYLLWPVRSLELGVHEQDEVLVGEIRNGTWAGVPLRGTITWQDEPMHVTADLVAKSAKHSPASSSAIPAVSEPPSGLPLDGIVWAEGYFEADVLKTDVWSHRTLRAHVRAAKSRVAFDGVESDTLPSGHVAGNALLDLSRADVLPYRAVFTAKDLDADALLIQTDLGAGLVAGSVDGEGDLRGRYEPGTHPTAALNGSLHLVARDGHVRHDLPAVLALTLAGEGLDFRSDREIVRYTTCESRLELTDGVAHTDGIEFEGPDVRMFGSGSLDLGHPPHALDSEVVVFLFRPVDRMLGAMPIVGNLILGGSDNLLAAYFELDGPWDAPTATYRPLRSLNAGPLRLVTGLPSVVMRGIESLGGTEPVEPLAENVVSPPGNGAIP